MADRIIIGVWYQSADAAKVTVWKNRGVETYIGPPTISGTWNVSTFCANLNAQGLDTLVNATDYVDAKNHIGTTLAIDCRPDYVGYDTAVNDPDYAGFSSWTVEPDEPDLDVNMVGYPDAIDKDATVAIWVARCGYLRTLRPLATQFGNFAGNDVSYCYNNGLKNQHTFTGLTWTDFELMADPLDIVGTDYYPITVGAPISNLVSRLAATSTLANGKPWLVFIECADQHLSDAGREPTPDEIRAEIWLALIHGASGIAYFPQDVGTKRPPHPNHDDNTSAAAEAEMIIQNALIKTEEANLLRPGVLVACPSPFYRRIVTLADGTKRAYTLNLSDAGQVWPGGDAYTAYEVKIGAIVVGTGDQSEVPSIDTTGRELTIIFDKPGAGTWNAAAIYETETKRPTIQVMDESSVGSGETVTRTLQVRYKSASVVGDQLVVVAYLAPYGTSNTDDNWVYKPIVYSLSYAVLTCVEGWLTDSEGNITGIAVADTAGDISVIIDNNSTQSYQSALLNWACFPYQRETGTFNIDVDASHPHGIHSVTLTIVDAASDIVSYTLTAPVLCSDTNSRGRWKKSSLYRFPINAADFTDGVATVEVTAIPRIGEQAQEATLTATWFLDAGNTEPPIYAVVNSVTGNDATGAVSIVSEAAAAAAPYLTIMAAARGCYHQRGTKADGGVVCLLNGNHVWGTYAAGLASATVNHPLIVRRATGATSAIITKSTDANGLRTKYIRLENLKAYSADAVNNGTIQAGPDGQHCFSDNCEFYGIGYDCNTTAGPLNFTVATWFKNCSFHDQKNGIVSLCNLFRGCEFYEMGSVCIRNTTSCCVVDTAFDDLHSDAGHALTSYALDVRAAMQVQGMSSRDQTSGYGISILNRVISGLHIRNTEIMGSSTLAKLIFEDSVGNTISNMLLDGLTLPNGLTLSDTAGSTSTFTDVHITNCYINLVSATGGVDFSDAAWAWNYFRTGTVYGYINDTGDAEADLFVSPATNNYTPKSPILRYAVSGSRPLPVDVTGTAWFTSDAIGPLHYPGTAPVVTISTADSSFVHLTSNEILASATDLEEDADIITATIVWTSNIQAGTLGLGGTLNSNVLNVGAHTLTATATNGDSLTGSDTVSITITSSSPTPTPIGPAFTCRWTGRQIRVV